MGGHEREVTGSMVEKAVLIVRQGLAQSRRKDLQVAYSYALQTPKTKNANQNSRKVMGRTALTIRDELRLAKPFC